MKPKSELTSRQHQVFKILRNAIMHRGVVPTIREIQKELRFKSSRAVAVHLVTLEKKGYIRREGGARGIRILKFQERGKPKSNVRYLPLVGQVAAGGPIFAEENIEEWVPVPSGMAHRDRSFLLRTRGDSMTGAHILDGDLLVVCPEHAPEEGDIVVALIDEEATVKRFYKKNGRVELRAENIKYEPIVVGSGQQILIQGKVVGVLRMERVPASKQVSQDDNIGAMEMGKNQHVVKTDDGWGVRGAGNSRLTSTHRTQSAASNAARTIAKHEKSEVVIHGRDGKIRDKDSFGPDPCPPRDRKH